MMTDLASEHDDKVQVSEHENVNAVPAVYTNTPVALQGLSHNQILEAYRAALHEHSLPVRNALKVYWKACLWILLLGTVSITFSCSSGPWPHGTLV